MSGNPAVEAIQHAYDVLKSIVDLTLPLMFGTIAVVVAANWALRMLRGDGGNAISSSSSDYGGVMPGSTWGESQGYKNYNEGWDD